MKKLYQLTFLIFTGFVLISSVVFSQSNQEFSAKESPVFDRFEDARFGMFVHWGPVALKGTEIGWSRGKHIPVKLYDQLYKDFNPTNFDAGAWVALMKDAGMNYLVMVTKHHDGFVMWDSKTTEYDMMSTPYKKDIIAQLAEECKKQDILFGTYYSIADWWHPDYPLEQNVEDSKEGADMEEYIKYMKAQIRELVEKYHTKILWFDGEWEEPWTHEMGLDLYDYIKSLDDEIIVNNRVDKGRRGMEGTTKSDEYAGDFATPEQQVGRFDTTNMWESCITIGTQWAWKPNDQLKSREKCIRLLVQTVGGGGNLLFNVGPKPDGTIEPRQALRLREMGAWLDEYGESIYGTNGGPLEPRNWGVCTEKGDQVYLHIMSDKEEIQVEDFPYEVTTATLLNTGSPVTYEQEGRVLDIYLSGGAPGAVDRIVKLTCKK